MTGKQMAEESVDSIEQDGDREDLLVRLDRLGLALSETRSSAIAGREDCGIEDEWLEDEEYYEGVDDANRMEAKAWRSKPLGQPYIDDEEDRSDEPGSSIFLNITRPYVDATSARMGDMLLPIDDRGWAISPTPLPELVGISEGNLPPEVREAIKQEQGGDPEKAFAQMKQVSAAVKDEIDKARAAAKQAEKQIEDWHVEGQYHAEVRKIIEDAAKVGTGVLKGPIPEKRVKMAYIGGKLQQEEKIKPASRRVYYRNFYPDPACGENLHQGNFTWERDEITRRGLMQLKGNTNYIDDQIDKCLEEGPQQATKEFRSEDPAPGLKTADSARQNMFEIWYYYGLVKQEELIAADVLRNKIGDDDEEEGYQGTSLFCQVVMVNNRVIKAVLSDLETGEFPYDIMVWQHRVGLPWGMGVARQIRNPQRMVNGAARHMMDNAGIAGGPMLFVQSNMIEPEDGIFEIKPWKIWVAGEDFDSNVHNPQHLIYFIKPDMIQGELSNIIEMGLKFAEDVTGLPLIMQGQTNQRTPATLGGMQIQNNNASTVLRRVARTFDDLITEPHIRRYYQHLLEYGDDEEMKGDFSIDARGSSALVERDIQNQSIMQVLQLSASPLYGLDPKKSAEEALKAMKLDIKRFQFDDEEWRQLVESMSQGQQDPRLAVAQLRAETDKQIKQFEKQWESMENDKDRQFQAAMDQLDKEVDIMLNEMKEQGDTSRMVETLKEKLFKTTATLRLQKEMHATDIATPAMEPAGRAEDGRSFEQ